MTSVVVVLGAGGIVGAAYHAGVVTALAEAGFDARDADLLVGTSAGASVAATLRADFPPLDLAARSLGTPISREATAIVGGASRPPTLDLRPKPLSRIPVPSSPGLLRHAVRNPAKAFVGMMPTGTVSADVISERIDAMYRSGPWPDRPLWICAVDLESGDRVVFGRNRTNASIRDASIGTAVQASSSIPGFFRPVTHAGRRYVDGGAHSPTNADLASEFASELPIDIVVVVSPMSATSDARRRSRPSARGLHARQLASEVQAIRSAGIDVLTFQPTPDDLAAMGTNAMDASKREATTSAALESARARLGDEQVAERLDLLRSASART